MNDVLIPILNKQYGTNYKKSDVTYWGWYKYRFTDPWAVTETPQFWDMVDIDPIAIHIIEHLVLDGHNVRLVTASHFHPALSHKIKTTLSLFKSNIINDKNIIIAQDKGSIIADVRIDDNPNNLFTNSCAILFAQPWNSPEDKCDMRTSDWYRIYRYIKNME